MISEMILPQQENKYITQKVNMLFPFVFQIGFMKILHITNLWTQSLAIVLFFSFFFFQILISAPAFLQTKLLTQYILNLGKYDQSYDIRDRTRFIRQLIVPSERSGALNKYARRILLAPKPAPVLESTFKGSSYIHYISLLSLF